MKKQYIRLFSSLIGITFILSGVIFSYTQSYKNEKSKTIEEEGIIADEIGNVYKTFFDKESELSSYRTTLMDSMNNYVSFYSTMPNTYNEMIEQLSNYETKIVEIEDISSYLNEKCKSKYSLVETNEKCIAYFINLEKTINIFVGDVKFFNSKIKEFNEWTKTENESVVSKEVYDELKEYSVKKYKDYVDLNNDGTYLGMNAD